MIKQNMILLARTMSKAEIDAGDDGVGAFLILLSIMVIGAAYILISNLIKIHKRRFKRALRNYLLDYMSKKEYKKFCKEREKLYTAAFKKKLESQYKHKEVKS